MAKSWDLRVGGMNLVGGSTADEGPANELPETPFRILIMADFSGKGTKLPLSQRKPIRIDRDNFEEVLAKLAPSVRVPLGTSTPEPATISFRELEDFEPDRLFKQLKVFAALGDLRRRLHNPAQFADAAAEIKGWAAASRIAEPEAPAPAPISTENLMEHILGVSESSAAPREASSFVDNILGTEWDRFIKQIVAPHLVSRTDPRLGDFAAVVDEAIGAQMRTILHHADFQALESVWRGLFLLVRRLDSDGQLQLSILDVSQEELAADIANVEDLAKTASFRHLVPEPRTGGTTPWALIVGQYTFGSAIDDINTLANIAMIASAARAPFLAAAHCQLLGCSTFWNNTEPREWQPDADLQSAWNQLRNMPEAKYLGLILPRFLLRLPYGKDAQPVEQFTFEEMPPEPPHQSYLWGNAAIAAALLLGESFTQSGWSLRPGQSLQVDSLPIHIHLDDGDRVQKPCAEVLLHNRAVERIVDTGLMALVSVQNRDAAMLARFQSVAASMQPLAGRWKA